MWAPETWADSMLPVADFLRITAALFRAAEQEAQVVARAALLQEIADAAARFEPGREKSVGYKRVVAVVTDLQR